MRRNLYETIIIFILAVCYSLTIAPGLTWAHFSSDGGDFITASATGGVPHPSGYPLYLILARCFQSIPVGTLAFRTNLLSAVCTIIASLILYAFLARALRLRPFAQITALFSALAYGTLPLIWGQALVTEVYALHGMLVITCLYLLDSEDSPRLSLLCGLVFGLSVSNHLTSLFLLPLLVLNSEKKIFVRPSSILKRGLGVFAGLLLYILLPLLALSNPPVNWGNPSTLRGFVWLVSGQVYQDYTFSLSMLDMLDRLRAVAGIFIEQFTLVGALLVIYGLTSHLPRKTLFVSVWISTVFIAFAVVYGSFDSQVYLLPVWMCFVIWLAYGVQDLFENLFAHSQIQMGLIVLLFAGLLARIVFVFPIVDVSNDNYAENFIADAIEQIPPGAIVFASGDEQIFSLWYMRFALKQRTDVIIIAEGLLQFKWYSDNLEHTYSMLNLPQKDQLQPFDLLAANPGRTVCYVSSDEERLKNNLPFCR